MPGTPHDTDRAKQIAHDLLDIAAVALQPDDPFRWSSGLLSPIYCDNRRTLAYPQVRRQLCEGFVNVMQECAIPSSTIAGTATAGIPHAAWLADALEAPMSYVRSAPKSHGRSRRIEGGEPTGRPTVVVEDLISTGGSALDAVAALQTVGADVKAVLSIFTYQLDAATEAFASADVPLYPLCTFDVLVEAARETGALSNADFESLRAWRANPSTWSAARGGKSLDP